MAGLFLGGLNSVLNKPNLNLVDLALFVALIWPRLTFHESAIAMAFGPLPLALGLFYIIRVWASTVVARSGDSEVPGPLEYSPEGLAEAPRIENPDRPLVKPRKTTVE